MLLMIHAEDQMSAAETFRILARKFRDIQQN
jgi:cellobiose-specific phosphotransferase system component IIA